MLAASVYCYPKSVLCRSSRSKVFCKKCVLRNFAKFTGNHLSQSLFFIKKEALAQVKLVNFAKFLRTPFFTEHLRWLLLSVERMLKKIPLIFPKYSRIPLKGCFCNFKCNLAVFPSSM